MPEINAIPSLLFQLVLNLVNNGIKFNRSETPSVVIRVTDREAYWQIEIEDNGIGIDEKYQDKIFQIFQRLNTKSEFPGTGIGLAICKKIAEQHGADISIESEVNKGSKFILTWPK